MDGWTDDCIEVVIQIFFIRRAREEAINRMRLQLFVYDIERCIVHNLDDLKWKNKERFYILSNSDTNIEISNVSNDLFSICHCVIQLAPLGYV